MRITRSLYAIIATILIAAVPLAAPAQFTIGVGFTVGSAPPPMPYYAQPAAPYPNYQWTPGYWGYGSAGYYWVPGTWVAPPSVGVYWTPGYWGASGGGYGWNAGYWGASVGFYGGINYGYGYPGTGFYGGSWNGGNFAYNTAYANVNKTVIHNTYNKTVVNKNVCNNCKNVSYNGGSGGINAKPTQAQIDARKNGRAPTTSQKNQATIASEDRNQLASVNKGKPTVTASQKAFDNSNKPSNFAPVTAADKQNAQNANKGGNAGASSNNANQPKHQNKQQQMQGGQQQPKHQNKQQQQMQGGQQQPQPKHKNAGGKPPQGGMQGNPNGGNPSGGGKNKGNKQGGNGQPPL
ncbi:MAG TPA: YXWGXW repeat-containing protein [Candidatus Cybelea sp.]|nr:YXWGXW repeat-containing protein [Candidatus Cybelea sp.]